MLGGAYEIDGSKLTLLLADTTLAECVPDSSYDLYVSLLGKDDGFELQNGRLILTVGDVAGQMGFADAGAAE